MSRHPRSLPWLAALGAAVLLVGEGTGAGFPFLPMHVTGSPFEGPAEAVASSLWWNPAALGPMHGLGLSIVGQGELARGEYARAPICRSTGAPGSCSGDEVRFPSQALTNHILSGFGVLTWNFNDSITIAFGAFAPWLSCPAASLCSQPRATATGSLSLPSAYHLESESYTTIYFSFAGSFRLTPRLFIGVAVSLVDMFVDYAFHRDSALDGGSRTVKQPGALCGGQACLHENPQAAERIQVHGDGGWFWRTDSTAGVPRPTGISANFGLLVRPMDKLWVGLSWQRVFPAFASAPSDPAGAVVTPATGSTGGCPLSPDGRSCVGGDVIQLALPDVWHVGARLRLQEAFEIAAWARVVVYGGYTGDDPTDRGLVVRLSGDAVSYVGSPSQIVFDYGLRPVLTLDVDLRWRPKSWLRLGLSLSAEPWGAVRPGLVSLAALDGPKIGALLGLELRVARWLRLTGSYGLTALIPVDSSPGEHLPEAAVACVDARYAVEACGDVIDGRAMPSSAGRYTLLRHHLAVGMLANF